ncbi:MAG: EF-hand domain-containing protein [Sphingomonadales bacterium]|nr:EF-hand domain-containing protein [Sphingomonadales bacterium]
MTRLPLAAALIGLASMAAAQTPPAAPAAPADGVSFETWATKARERLMALDANHDGKISKDEFAARAGMMGGRHAEAPAAGANASAPGQDGGRGARMFDRFDANQDGSLDGQEINAILARRFARMDANHDGVLTPDERQAMRGANAPEQ